LTPFPPDYPSKNRGNHGEGDRSFDSVITYRRFDRCDQACYKILAETLKRAGG
jgi:hypothetical protein